MAAPKRRRRPGPLGTFSRGQLHKDDRGDLCIQIHPDRAEGLVHIHFGTEVSWLGLTAEDATTIAMALLNAAQLLGLSDAEAEHALQTLPTTH